MCGVCVLFQLCVCARVCARVCVRVLLHFACARLNISRCVLAVYHFCEDVCIYFVILYSDKDAIIRSVTVVHIVVCKLSKNVHALMRFSMHLCALLLACSYAFMHVCGFFCCVCFIPILMRLLFVSCLDVVFV